MNKFIQHALAAAASTLVLTVIPLLIYVVVAIMANDMGGFLTPFLLPIISLVAAGIVK